MSIYHYIFIQFFPLQCQIEIIGLPPHTTHILQPLDVGVFGHVKRKFNEICLSLGKRSSRYCVTKSCFPAAWKNAITQGATAKIIKSSFERCGIYPFDPTAVDDSQIQDNYMLVLYLH